MQPRVVWHRRVPTQTNGKLTPFVLVLCILARAAAPGWPGQNEAHVSIHLSVIRVLYIMAGNGKGEKG